MKVNKKSTKTNLKHPKSVLDKPVTWNFDPKYFPKQPKLANISEFFFSYRH